MENLSITLPQPPDLPGYTWRAPQRDDAPAIHALLQALEAAEPRYWYSSLDDRYLDFEDPDIHPESDALLAFDAAGEAIAMGWVELVHAEGEALLAFLWGEVHPAHRNRGLGSFVMNWMEARAGQIMSGLRGKAGIVRTPCLAGAKDRIRLIQAHGFTAVRYFSRMRRDLGRPLPQLQAPGSLEICNWTPGLDHAAWQAFNQAFSDHWGFMPAPESSWQMWITRHASFRPDLSFLALQGGEVVSFVLCQERKTENLASGVQEFWIRDVGTVRLWRKQGLASLLMGYAMRAGSAAGFTHVGLNVDAENPTGALRLYEDLGFKMLLQSIAFEKLIL